MTEPSADLKRARIHGFDTIHGVKPPRAADPESHWGYSTLCGKDLREGRFVWMNGESDISCNACRKTTRFRHAKAQEIAKETDV